MPHSTNASSSELLIQSSITIVMIFVALMLGDMIQPWGTKVSLSVLAQGAPVGKTALFQISGIWLVLGAVSMSYLLFGWRVLPAVFIGFHISALYVYGWSLNPFALTVSGNLKTFAWINHAHALVTTLGPLLAIYTMRTFRLSKFFEAEKLVFQHVVFLMILAAFFNTFAKFFIDTSFRTWLELPIRVDEATYVPAMLIGDLTGGIGFVFVLALVVVPIIRMLVPEVISKE
ncbi:MAG: hypothetical protein NZ775_02045 [Gammaproteobacteria bacterium]|nr:hypothetical protein [Gammaproteobacteria bacterium]